MREDRFGEVVGRAARAGTRRTAVVDPSGGVRVDCLADCHRRPLVGQREALHLVEAVLPKLVWLRQVPELLQMPDVCRGRTQKVSLRGPPRRRQAAENSNAHAYGIPNRLAVDALDAKRASSGHGHPATQ